MTRPHDVRKDRIGRFMVLCDTHVRDPAMMATHPTSWAYPRVDERNAWAVRCARGEKRFDPIDFIIGAGDMVDGFLEEIETDYAYFKRVVLDRISVPFYPCPGNHDTLEGRNLRDYQAYDATFGPDRRQYTFEQHGITFIVVDTSGTLDDPGPQSEARNTFAAAALQRCADENKNAIIVSHIPLIAVRDQTVYENSFGWPTHTVRDTGLLALVDQYAQTVVAVISGHIHFTGVTQRLGVHHIVVAGTASHPADIATLDIYADRLAVQMHAAPADLWEPWANLHGRPRHPVDFTDSTHADPESYLWGHASERMFTMPLHHAIASPPTDTHTKTSD